MCWEPFESPWIRHGFLAPDCSYVERIKVKKICWSTEKNYKQLFDRAEIG